jgi:phenylalanyl-tRNA synthetase beta chain
VRAFGIENVPVRDRSRFTPQSEADRSYDFESELRARLVGRGLSEVRSSKLISRNATEFEHAVKLRNPLNEDHVALRASFYMPLLYVWDRNISGGAERIAIFELGRVFRPPDAKEERHLGILLWGELAPSAHWRSYNRLLDNFDLKGVIESVMGVVTFKPVDRLGFVFAVEIWSEGRLLGYGGQVALEYTKTVGPTRPVLVAELNLDSQIHSVSRPTFREIEKFPSVKRDIAMIVPEKLNHAEIVAAIEGAREPLLATIELFDLFSGKEAAGLGAGKKSMAYTLTYRDRTRTLTNDEITVVHAKIRDRLQRELGVELRE